MDLVREDAVTPKRRAEATEGGEAPEAGRGTCATCGREFPLSHHQHQVTTTARLRGKVRRVYCSKSCVRQAQPCMVCVHESVVQVDHLIHLGVGPSRIIESLGLAGISAHALAHHRLRHVQKVPPQKAWKRGRCLACEDSVRDDIDRLIRAGVPPSEVVPALDLTFPAVCVGRHKRKCLGIAEAVVTASRPLVSQESTSSGRKAGPRLEPRAMTEEQRLRHNERIRERARALRLEVLSRYGGSCACCGEEREPFLSIDHINGDGAEHRRAICGDWSKGSGSRVYRWLKANGFPADGFRVLCHNCNMARAMRGECPHEVERSRASMGVAS